MHLIISSVLFSVIGIYLIKDGRRQLNSLTMAIGVTLLFYEYLVQTPTALWAIGGLLTLVGFFTRGPG